MVGWGNFLRLLEEGVEVEGKATVCYRKQARDLWALATLHSLQKQATLLIVDDGEGPMAACPGRSGSVACKMAMSTSA